MITYFKKKKMKNEFVPYELAVKLKTLGFDEPCFGGYNPNPVNDDDLGTLIYPTIKLNFEDENIIFNDTESNEPNCWTIKDDVILAPTYSQVFRWFREKYKLHSTITSISQESWQWHITKPGESLGKLYDEDFYTYEEAETACLEKLIEIVESKTEK
jgi:hypothetical protein